MDTASFLSLVLARTGHPCIVTPSPKGKKGFWHHPCNSTEAAAKVAIGQCKLNKDVFFAVGTLKQREVRVEREDNTVKKSYRIASNISHWRCWIADLDVGNGNNKYPSQIDAIKHLKSFCEEVGLPMPMLVSSGYGVHAYWVCNADIPAEIWQKVAVEFKALLHAYGVLADPSRTSDVASVLRVVGTKNFKRETPKDVIVLREQTHPLTPKEFYATVQEASKKLNVPPPIEKTSKPADSGLGSFDIPKEPVELAPIAKECNQVRKIVQTKGDVPQGYWYKGLQLLQHCKHKKVEPNKLAHELSKGHAEYSFEDTEEKLKQASPYGPTLCSAFEKENPGGCTDCPHKGRIKTPWVLGMEVAEADAPVMQIVHRDGSVDEIEIPNPPEPFVRTTTGKLGRRVRDPESGTLHTEVFYDYDIHPTKRMLDEETMTEIFYFRSWLPKDGWREYVIPASMVYDPKNLFMTMANRGVMPETKNQGLVVQYMLTYMKKLQTIAPAETIYAQMGWKKDGSEFIAGDITYKTDGTNQRIKLTEGCAKLANNFDSKGTLEEWKKITSLYNKVGYEDFALAFMAGFGAPMFEFSGFEGGIFSLSGTSGGGKSTVLRVIHSIYGKPLHNVILERDTENSKSAVLGAYNNLPVTFDELTSIQAEKASQLTFAITDGRDKRRLNSDASLRTAMNMWRLLLFTTTNRSLTQMILSYKPEATGEMMRIMERSVNPLNEMTMMEGRKWFDPLKDNYGVAGPVLLSWYVQNLEEAKRLYNKYIDELSEAIDALVPERFWLAICALALLGCHVGRKLGLHEYSQERMFAHCCKVIVEARTTTAVNVKFGIDVLTDFLNSSIGETLVVYESTKNKSAEIRIRPRSGALAIRSELVSKRIYIDRTAMRIYCSAHGYDFSGVQQQLLDKGVLLRADASKHLGESTEFVGGTTKVWVIDATNSLMTGAAPITLQGTPDNKPKEETA